MNKKNSLLIFFTFFLLVLTSGFWGFIRGSKQKIITISSASFHENSIPFLNDKNYSSFLLPQNYFIEKKFIQGILTEKDENRWLIKNTVDGTFIELDIPSLMLNKVYFFSGKQKPGVYIQVLSFKQEAVLGDTIELRYRNGSLSEIYIL